MRFDGFPLTPRCYEGAPEQIPQLDQRIGEQIDDISNTGLWGNDRSHPHLEQQNCSWICNAPSRAELRRKLTDQRREFDHNSSTYSKAINGVDTIQCN